MRFLLYNIRYGTGGGSRLRMPISLGGYLRRTARNLASITEFLQAQHPDIVGLVEVDGGSYRSGRSNQAETIAQALGHYHLHASKYAHRSLVRSLPIVSKQVNAFLSRDRMHGTRFHYFDRGIKRLVIELELEAVTLFLVHLSLKFRHRQRQLTDLYELLKHVNKPKIVAGDFNVLWGNEEVNLFLGATGLRNANHAGLPSYPSWRPRRQLDFILHSPEIRITHFQIPSVTFSDHLPLVCDFEIGR